MRKSTLAQKAAKNVALVRVNNDFGKGGRDSITKALEAEGIKIAADISTDPGQVDFSGAILRAKQSNTDALFMYTNEEESARALRELRKQGYEKPIKAFDDRFQKEYKYKSAHNGMKGHSDQNGDLDCESFLVEVVNGKQVVSETLPPVFGQ